LSAYQHSQRAPRDLTAGSLGGHLLRLTLPCTAEIAVFSLSALVHTWWLSRLGGTALAAVAVGTTLRLVLISPMMGLSAGGMALVARAVGAGDRRQADHALLQTALLVLAFALPIALVGLVFMRTFLGWMGATGSLLEEATLFLRIIFVGLFFMECLPTMTGVIRGAGHPEQTLRINLTSVAALMLLDLLLLSGFGPLPSLGVIGAGLASVLASAVGVAVQYVVLRRGTAGVSLHRLDLRPDWPMMRRILRIAFPVSLQRLAPNLGAAVVTWLINTLATNGTNVLTAYSIITQVFGLLSGPSLGVASATAPLVGQNLGAGRPERSARAGWLGAVMALGLAVAILAPVAARPTPVLRLFTQDEAVLVVGAAGMPLLVMVPVVTAWLQVMLSALSAAGDALWTTWLAVGYQAVQALLCLALRPAWGPSGIWLGLALGALAGAVAMTVRFRSGAWKRIVV
jgi:putative MATE family efflux protein